MIIHYDFQKSRKYRYFLLLFLYILIMAAGQISAKYGSLQSSEYELPVKTGLNIFHILIILNKQIIGAK